MNTQFQQWGNPYWHTAGDIVDALHQQHFRVFAIEYDDQWYAVDAYDQQGVPVELKVNPQTSKIVTWIIRSENLNDQTTEARLHVEPQSVSRV